MLVICLSKCPPALRGDLTRWLQEIDTGVYAGHVSARVREELWERIVSNIKDGRATMVYSARNEQRMEFRVHNTGWIPIDFDGLKLMLRPRSNLPRKAEPPEESRGYSTATAIRRAKKFGARGRRAESQMECYVVIDVETTGLSGRDDRIIEIGAVRVENGEIAGQFEVLIKYDGKLPEKVRELTGITDEMLAENGVPEAEALQALLSFSADLPLVMHNMAFDLNFLRQACRRCGLPMPANRVTDTLSLAKHMLDDIDNFKLTTIAAYFGIEPSMAHRSLSDCITTKLIYEKLIEFL